MSTTETTNETWEAPPGRKAHVRAAAVNASAEKTATPKLAYSVLESCAALGITRPTLYGLIADGRLRTIKVGARRLIPATELHRLLAGDTNT